MVVTGVGLVTPLGCGSRLVWQRLCRGRSGLHLGTFGALQDVAVGTVPRGLDEGDFSDRLLEGPLRDMARFAQYAAHAADLAVEDAGGLR